MARDVDASMLRESLLQKGFQAAAHGRRDHYMYFFFLDGKKTSIWVKLSHGARHLSVREMGMNARSVGLKLDDLHKILSCEHDAVKTREVCAAAVA